VTSDEKYCDIADPKKNYMIHPGAAQGIMKTAEKIGNEPIRGFDVRVISGWITE
jgi:hypothetical protein